MSRKEGSSSKMLPLFKKSRDKDTSPSPSNSSLGLKPPDPDETSQQELFDSLIAETMNRPEDEHRSSFTEPRTNELSDPEPDRSSVKCITPFDYYDPDNRIDPLFNSRIGPSPIPKIIELATPLANGQQLTIVHIGIAQHDTRDQATETFGFGHDFIDQPDPIQPRRH